MVCLSKPQLWDIFSVLFLFCYYIVSLQRFSEQENIIYVSPVKVQKNCNRSQICSFSIPSGDLTLPIMSREMTAVKQTTVQERESILWAQTLDNCMQMKFQALGHCKKPVKLFVLSGTPRQLHKFLSWFEVHCGIVDKTNRFIFLKIVAVCWMSTVAQGLLGHNWYLSSFA